MAKSRHSSFRRILLRRLLLLSIPVLITGEIVAYQKARSGLLETARMNLTASAVRKADNLRSSIATLRSNLAIAASSSALRSDSTAALNDFLQQLQRTSPIALQCVQLINAQSKTVKASTCGSEPIAQVPDPRWLTRVTASGRVDDRTIRVGLAPSLKLGGDPSIDHQLSLVMTAPVLVQSRPATADPQQPSPPYVLSIQASLYPKPDAEVTWIAGYTIVIDSSGTILAHPMPEKIGRNIRQEADADRLQRIVESAVMLNHTPANADPREPIEPHVFEDSGTEWLTGASKVEVALGNSDSQNWVVLATTSVDGALYSLGDIKQVLIILTLGLLTAILLATLYLTRDLSRPIEQLSEYALKIRQRYHSDRAPKDFKVRELNDLAEALDSMVDRLEERANELEAAWQEAQAANQSKSEFLATTSHELRTPLNAIIGCVRLVRDGCCDDREEELEFLQQADDAAIHLLQIINDLLDIAKIEAGKVEMSLKSIDIQAMCQECLKMVQPGAEMKRLTLSMNLDEQIAHVPIDERRVRQMVINLLSNAVKFTPEGGKVSLVARIGYGYQLAQDIRPDRSPVNLDTTYLCLEVEDSGIGIPKDRWHLLFRPFQQIDSSLTRKHEGTGLGLALTKRLAELHGGTLSFWSVPGKGSTFRIWLPLLEPDSEPRSQPSEEAKPKAESTLPTTSQPVSLPNN